MKPRSLSVLTVIFSLCLLIFACRKEIGNFVHDRDNASSTLLESAKIWYLQRLDTKSLKQGKKPSRLRPHWKDSWTAKANDSSSLLIVPAAEYYVNNRDYTVRQFLKPRAAKFLMGEL